MADRKDKSKRKGQKTDPVAENSSPQPPENQSSQISIFDVDEGDILTGLEIRRPDSEPKRDSEISALQTQVEDISKSKNTSLTVDQTEVLKKYISLKEAEVRDIKEQQRQYQTFIKKVCGQLEGVTRKNRELLGELETLRSREESQRSEIQDLKQRHQAEIETVKNDYEERLRRSGNYESQIEELVKQREEWREKVREDLKRIKLKERELENKYELLKRDTQALLDSKDKHVLELKKKNDALELELETLEDRLRQGNVALHSIDSKKRRLIETFKLAIALLEEIDRVDTEESDAKKERKAG